MLPEAQVEARCTQVEARYGAGFGEASLEFGRHIHLEGGRMEWGEGGRKPGVGVEPEAKGARASKRRKRSALASLCIFCLNNLSPWQGSCSLVWLSFQSLTPPQAIQNGLFIATLNQPLRPSLALTKVV